MPQLVTEKPTKEGYYWAILPGGGDYFKGTEPTTVKVVSDRGHLAAVIVGWECQVHLDSFSHWLGPLAVPELPEGE